MTDRMDVLAILADVEREFAETPKPPETEKLQVEQTTLETERRKLAAQVERDRWIAAAPGVVVVISALVAVAALLVLLFGR